MGERSEQGRAGSAVIVGRPNVGKSTLLNRILGEKIAIVSHHPQTTRNRVLGVRTLGGNQLVLIDTPGIHRKRANLNRFMVQEALESLHGVDCVVLMTEVASSLEEVAAEEVRPVLHPEDMYVLEQIQLQEVSAPVVVAINKIDRLQDRRKLLPLMAGWHERGFEALVPIAARDGDGVDALLDEVIARLPEGPFLYPEDMLTDRAERFLAAELIREQVFERCRQEIPYSTAVEVIRFEDRPERKDVRLEAVIHVERESQKAILIGKGGASIKAIGTAAREQIGRLLDCKVHLQLTVHVETNWTRSPTARRRLGYDS